jgi:hypothetical protein
VLEDVGGAAGYVEKGKLQSMYRILYSINCFTNLC